MGNQIDGETGRILFNNAADTTRDLQALADRLFEDSARSVATVAALADVPRKRPGMRRMVEADRTVWEYVSSAVGWVLHLTTRPIAYTPTWTGIAVGNGNQAWKYTAAGGRIHVSGFLVVGSGTTFPASDPYMTVPVPAAIDANSPNGGGDYAIGVATIQDNQVQTYSGVVLSRVSGGVLYVRPRWLDASGTSLKPVPINGTAPFAFDAGDFITAEFSYTHLAVS